MKRILLVLLITFAAYNTFAQSIHIGIKGGLNLSRFSYYSPYIVYRPNDMTPGFHIGGIVNFAFKNIGIQSGLQFTTAGDQYTYQTFNANQSSAGSATYVTTLNYIQLPVNIVYQLHIDKGTSLHFGAGPYLGYGVSGKLSNGNSTTDIKFTNDPPNIFSYELRNKNPDYGVNFLAGLQLKNNIIIDAGYGLGLANLTYGSASQYNRVLSFSVGYMFR